MTEDTIVFFAQSFGRMKPAWTRIGWPTQKLALLELAV